MADNDQTSVPFPNPGVSQGPSLPGNAPVAGQPTGPFDQDAMSAAVMQQLLPLMMKGANKGMQAADAMGPLSQPAPVPPMGYHPHFESPSGKGFLGGLGAILGDIGKGALVGLGGGTGIGRSIENSIYAPGIRQYQAQQAQKAQQLEALKAQMGGYETAAESAGRGIEGIGRLGYEQGMLGAKNRQTDINQYNAQTRRQAIDNTKDFRDQLLGVDWAKLNEAQRHNAQDEKLRGMGIDVLRDGNNIRLTLGNQTATIKQSEFDAGVSNKSQGFFDQLGQALGLKTFMGTGGPTTPLNTTAPALGGGKPSAKSGGGKSVVKWGRDAQGNPVRLP